MAKQFCDYCHKEVTLVVYDHGKRYHADCFAELIKHRLKSCEPNCDICRRKQHLITGDWSEGKYET